MSLQPHGRRLRVGRVSVPGQVYAVTTVTRDRRAYFSEFPPARAVVRVLREQRDLQRAETLAYVVMPDHLHWLMRLVSCPTNNLPFRAPQKRQGKAHTAGNGRPLARCATPHWRFCGAPFGRGCAGVWRCYACLKGGGHSCASVPGHTPAQSR